ncbi:MAG: hypothetical protein FJ202_06840 [Gemmatimonadetes bacterium]|nr:hypothetical protein [Gemmatimonadota bacterium]
MQSHATLVHPNSRKVGEQQRDLAGGRDVRDAARCDYGDRCRRLDHPLGLPGDTRDLDLHQ